MITKTVHVAAGTMPALREYVPPNESVRARWEGTHRNGGGVTDVVVGTTENSLVFHAESARFGLLPREHVSSVESHVETRVRYGLDDHRLYVAGGVALAVVTFVGAVVASPWLLSLILLAGTCAGLWLVERGWRHRESYDGFRRLESDVELVVVRTDAGDHHEFQFPADERAGAEIGTFVRAE
jgi:hypothetical protein